jgi:hypothetical protein
MPIRVKVQAEPVFEHPAFLYSHKSRRFPVAEDAINEPEGEIRHQCLCFVVPSDRDPFGNTELVLLTHALSPTYRSRRKLLSTKEAQ